MLVSCLSLTGIPLTIGFFGKALLIMPAWAASANTNYSHMMVWLVVIMVMNAAVSAAYYLRIVAYMFLRQEPADTAFGITREPARAYASVPVAIAIILSVIGTLYFGIVLPGTDHLTARAQQAAQVFPRTTSQVATDGQFFNRSGR